MKIKTFKYRWDLSINKAAAYLFLGRLLGPLENDTGLMFILKNVL